MFYRWICCLWKMMGLAFIAFLFDIYQDNLREVLFSEEDDKPLLQNEQEIAEDLQQDVIGDDEDEEIVRASRSKRTRRIDSSDCHKAAQKSVYVLKNAVHPTDVVLNHK